MSDQCPTCNASPTSRLAVMKHGMALAARLREADERDDEATALLAQASRLLCEHYGPTLGLVQDINAFLLTPTQETQK